MAKSLIYIAHDNLNRNKGALKGANPADCEILFVESQNLLRGARWHKQRVFFLLSAARHFAQELRDEGFVVHYLEADNTASGIRTIASK